MRAVAGPDALYLRTDVPLRGEDFTTVAEFAVAAGEQRAVRPDLAPRARARIRRLTTAAALHEHRGSGGASGRPAARTTARGATR